MYQESNCKTNECCAVSWHPVGGLKSRAAPGGQVAGRAGEAGQVGSPLPAGPGAQVLQESCLGCGPVPVDRGLGVPELSGLPGSRTHSLE